MKDLYFFLGTEAEFIKVFPIIIEAKKRGINYYLIASGQNDVANCKLLHSINCGEVDVELSYEKDIRKSIAGLFFWWGKTYSKAIKKIKEAFPDANFSNGIMIVHGDTISTYMGAKIGKRLGMQVCHVEAGLRSHNILSPFPEEIDRLLTSKVARIHFAPGDVACSNLKNSKGKVINTYQNTLLDSLRYSQDIPIENEQIKKLLDEEYCVFIMHRQENLIRKAFVEEVVSEVLKIAKSRKVVIILHKITENAFVKYGVMDSLRNNPNVILLPRVEYFDFMKVLKNSTFVITDGGSNQEELYYMNKPCLILRTNTERDEGIGFNARLFDGQASDIGVFVKEYNKNYIGKGEEKEGTPSKIIIETLMAL